MCAAPGGGQLLTCVRWQWQFEQAYKSTDLLGRIAKEELFGILGLLYDLSQVQPISPKDMGGFSHIRVCLSISAVAVGMEIMAQNTGYIDDTYSYSRNLANYLVQHEVRHYPTRRYELHTDNKCCSVRQGSKHVFIDNTFPYKGPTAYFAQPYDLHIPRLEIHTFEQEGQEQLASRCSERHW